jgi:hypothetical protein
MAQLWLQLAQRAEQQRDASSVSEPHSGGESPRAE